MLRDVSTVSLSTTLDYIRQGQHKGSKRGRNKKKGLMKYSAAVHNPAYNNHRGMMRTRSEADMHIYHHSSGKKGKSKRRKQGRHVEDIIYTLDFPPAIDLDLHKHCFEAMKHVRVSKKHASYFEHFTFCHESEEIVKKLFWFTFCTYFQKNGEYERDKLIQQVSQEYTKLIYQLMTPPKRFDKYERPVYDIQFKKRKEQAIAISVSKDKFMQAYPFLLASIIFDIYCSVFPGSLNLFDNDFLQRLEYDYNLLLAGVKLAKTTLTKMRERVFPDSVMHVDDDMAANSLHVAHSRLPARHQHHHKQHLHSSKFDGGPGNDGETKGRNDGGNTNENDNSSESEDEHELQLDASGNPASIGGERKAARGEGDKSLSRSLSRSSVPIERQIKADVEHASRSQTPFEMIKQRENKDKRYRQKHMRMRPRKVSFNTNLLTPVMQRGLGQSTASRLWQSSRKVSHVMPLDDSLLGGENTFTPFVPQEYMAKSDLLIEQCNEVRRHAQHLPGFPFQRGKSKNDKRMNKSKSTGFLLSSSSSSSMGRKNNKHRYSVSSLHHHQGPKGKLSRSSSRRSIMGKNIGISPLVNDDNPLMESLNNSVDMSELNEFTHGGGGGIHDDQF